MGSKITCFFLESTDTAEETYRRFVWSGKGARCPKTKQTYHNAQVLISIGSWMSSFDGEGLIPSEERKTDPRWPKECECGYVFSPEDPWQHGWNRLFQRSDGGGLTTLANAPVGAMWYADWMPKNYKGEDGHCLVVRTPGGDWCVDGPSSNGNGWTRTGLVPDITARPSILMGEVKSEDGKVFSPGYHGFLTNGVLIEC